MLLTESAACLKDTHTFLNSRRFFSPVIHSVATREGAPVKCERRGIGRSDSRKCATTMLTAGTRETYNPRYVLSHVQQQVANMPRSPVSQEAVTRRHSVTQMRVPRKWNSERENLFDRSSDAHRCHRWGRTERNCRVETMQWVSHTANITSRTRTRQL